MGSSVGSVSGEVGCVVESCNPIVVVPGLKGRAILPPRSRIGFWVQWLLSLLSGCNCECWLQVDRLLLELVVPLLTWVVVGSSALAACKSQVAVGSGVVAVAKDVAVEGCVL